MSVTWPPLRQLVEFSSDLRHQNFYFPRLQKSCDVVKTYQHQLSVYFLENPFPEATIPSSRN
jgi:hypothetical protein